MSVDYRIGDTRAVIATRRAPTRPVRGRVVTRIDSLGRPNRTERELLQLLAGAHQRLDERHVPPADYVPAYRALEHT